MQTKPRLDLGISIIPESASKSFPAPFSPFFILQLPLPSNAKAHKSMPCKLTGNSHMYSFIAFLPFHSLPFACLPTLFMYPLYSTQTLPYPMP